VDEFMDKPTLSLMKSQAYIDGAWVGEPGFAVTDKATDDVLCQVPDQGPEDARAAITAAETAFKGWSALLAKERSIILRKWYDLIIANIDELALLLTYEQGKPLAEARGEILYGAGFVEYFAEQAKRIYGETIPSFKQGARIVTIKQPIGVVAAITPWNFPNAMITRKVTPALAAGCTAVVKPAEDTPLSALALAALAEQAGLPKGVLNIVTTKNPEEIGKVLTTDPRVRLVTFTGSTEVGKILMTQAASTVKKVGLELGGNAPFIVFDDADLDSAVDGAMVSKYRNAGQTCVCANRIYVQDGVYEAFAEKLAERVAKLKIGAGTETGVTIGPMINEAGIAKVEEHVADAVAKGAKIKAGGKRLSNGKNFFEPTILTDVTNDMRVASEETFGPVAPLFSFRDEADVIRSANDTKYGLAAYFYARDIGRVWRVAEALEFGMVGINEGVMSSELAPFGGVKESGLGREGSHHGIEEFVEIKYLLMGGL
jgi:succinate-semialdehyde dehydrogenase / glutarate-semialdehyde dehydrogenase